MRRTIRIFLSGVLCGVIMAAALTFTLTIPGVDNHWRMEIWKRGGAMWVFDRNGHLSWKWKAQPISETTIVPRPQRISHSSQEQL